jgi:hypothetical protein
MTTPLLSLLAILAGAPPAPAGAASAPAEPQGKPLAESAGAEMLERASADVARIRRALKEVLTRVEDARDEKDLVKLLCADEKLSRLKVIVSVAEKADVALAEAVAARDEGAVIESSKIAIARGKADALRAEAAGCIGQLAYEVGGRTTVFVQEAEALPPIYDDEDAASTRPNARQDPYRHEFGIPAASGR